MKPKVHSERHEEVNAKVNGRANVEVNPKYYPELSVIIPVHNEGTLLEKSIRTIYEHMYACCERFELVLVDDGSTDDSWDVILRLKEQYDCITAIRFSRNFGKEDAISAGMEHARGNGVILMDADLQHPPVLLKEMIRLWREDGYEVVECIKSHRGKESLRNKWGSKFFYYLLNRLSGYDLKGATDYKLLDWKVVKAWRQMPERNTFFRGMVAWLGFRRAVLAFEVPERIGGQTNWNFTQLIRLAIKAIVSFSTLPLKAVSLIGVLFLLGAIVLGVQTLHLKMTGNAVTGFTTVILLQLMIGSIIMVSLGVIGEYIAAIYSETKGRPRYIVDEYVKAKDKDRIDS